MTLDVSCAVIALFCHVDYRYGIGDAVFDMHFKLYDALVLVIP